MKLGVHVSTAGAIYEAPERAHLLGANTMQIFSRNPQQWRCAKLSTEDIAEFRRRCVKYKISPVAVHVAYLLNLASPNPRLYNASVKAFGEDLREAESLGAEYLVTHMGSHKNTGEREGLKRLARALNRALEKTQGAKAAILLENTAGSGSWLGYTFGHQKKVLAAVPDKKRLGLCLDTAHAFLAGFDLSNAKGIQALVDEIDAQVGIERVKLIHLNDAYGKLGCHIDRHEHIGKGGIGPEGMRRIINHPKLRDIPFILETPKDSDNADKLNLATVRAMRKKE